METLFLYMLLITCLSGMGMLVVVFFYLTISMFKDLFRSDSSLPNYIYTKDGYKRPDHIARDNNEQLRRQTTAQEFDHFQNLNKDI